MSSDALRKDLSRLIGEQLQQMQSDSLFSFLGESAETRLLGVEEGPQALVLQLASDGMSLDQKILVEQRLLKAVPDTFGKVVVYFKRQKSLGDRIQAPQSAEAPAPVRKNALGVTQKLKPIPGVKRIVAVSSGKGGVGKSTVSVNLAVGLAAEGRKVGLLDADLYGPSAGILMGVEGPMPISADQKMIPIEKYGVKIVSFGFMTDPYSPVIWRGPMISKALEQLFYQVEWGEIDELIIDLPPGTGDVQLTIIENLPLHAGIVVSTPQAVALLDAHKGLSMFEKLQVPVLGLVENMSHFQCSVCGHEDDVFGQAQIEQFSIERKVPILARIPLHRRIRQASDEGRPAFLSEPSCGQYYLPLIEAVIEHADRQ